VPLPGETEGESARLATRKRDQFRDACRRHGGMDRQEQRADAIIPIGARSLPTLNGSAL